MPSVLNQTSLANISGLDMGDTALSQVIQPDIVRVSAVLSMNSV